MKNSGKRGIFPCPPLLWVFCPLSFTLPLHYITMLLKLCPPVCSNVPTSLQAQGLRTRYFLPFLDLNHDPLEPKATELCWPLLLHYFFLQLRLVSLNSPRTGALHGARGVDHQCYRQAREANIRGTFRAFLAPSFSQSVSIVEQSGRNLESIVRFRDRDLPVVNLKVRKNITKKYTTVGI